MGCFTGGKIPLDKTPEVEITTVIVHITVGNGVYISMCFLAGVGILVAMGFLIFNIKFRNQR